MSKKLYDLAVKTGEYTNAQGETKGRYQNVGAVMQNDDGGKFLMIARWFNPAGVPDLSGRGGDSVLVSMFKPSDGQGGGHGGGQGGGKQRTQQAPAPAQRQSAQAEQRPPVDDDIPF